MGSIVAGDRFFLIDEDCEVVDWPTGLVGVSEERATGRHCWELLKRHIEWAPSCRHCSVHLAANDDDGSAEAQDCGCRDPACTVLPKADGSGALVWLRSPFESIPSSEAAVEDLLLQGTLSELMSAPDLSDGVNGVLDLMRGMFGADDAELFRVDPNDGDLVLSYVRGRDVDALREKSRFSAGTGFAGLVTSTQESLSTRNLSQERRYLRSAPKRAGLNSYLCVPVCADETAIGSLHLAWRSQEAPIERATEPLLRAAKALSCRLSSETVDSDEHGACGTCPGALRLATTTAKLDIRCLGSFEVYREGALIPREAFTRRKALTLLRLLILQAGNPLSRDAIVEHLWPESDPVAGARRLYVVVHALRAALEPDIPRGRSTYIRSQGGFYYFNMESSHRTDLYRFRRLHALAQRNLASDSTKHTTVRWLEQAAKLYRGDLFDDDLEADWCIHERVGLREQFLGVLSQLAQFRRERGEPELALAPLRRALKCDELREDIHRNLIETLMLLGRRKEATDQFDQCARILRDELGVEPSYETQQLRHQLAGLN